MASWLSRMASRRRPALSLVVVVFDIPQQAARTLYSLSAAYQRDLPADAYEVIVVDNGSTPPFDRAVLDRLDGNFQLLRIENAPPSPARAINRGLARARGDVVGIMIDGARLVTPGLLHAAVHGAGMFERTVVATLGWQLGFDVNQRMAADRGYDVAREEALLASIDWPQEGYRLFEIAALDGSSINGWLSVNGESNALFLSRAMWDALGGVDERFDAPGGGVLNLDTYRRALELPGAELVVLLGEATFHQVHGGVATGAAPEAFGAMLAGWLRQYEAIRGRPWTAPLSRGPRRLLGHLPRPALAHFLRAGLAPVPSMLAGLAPPLGATFDPALWVSRPSAKLADASVQALAALAEAEFRAGRYPAAAAVIRLARARVPDDTTLLPLLAHASVWSPGHELPVADRIAVHLALGTSYRLLGDTPRASAEFRAALALDGDCAPAHLALAALRMPGDNYVAWLRRLHDALRPETYLEIGIFDGTTLALARPPTRAFGVDPEPSLTSRLHAETHVFAETSDAFFAARRLAGLLGGRPLKLAFVDGMHSFEQCLRDVTNLEAWCDATSAVLVHDTVPLDAPTQARNRETVFWTGDVWKTLLALKHYRPDLDVFTIPAAPTGLTVVTGFDPASRVLAEAYDDAVRRFVDLPFSEVEGRLDGVCGFVPNDWGAVAERLETRGIL